MIGGLLFSAAFRDFLKPKRLLTWALVAVGLFGLAKVYMATQPNSDAAQTYVELSGILGFRLLALVAAIFSSMVLSQEVEQKTIVYLLTRPVDRKVMLLSRLAAAVAITALVSLLGLVSIGLAVHGFGLFGNEYFLKDIKALLMGAVAYSSLFVLISLIVNRAMLVCLIFAFGWETVIPNFQGSVYLLSIYSYLTTIAERPSISAGGMFQALAGQLGTNTLATGTAWTVMIILSAVCIGVAAWWFSAFEYTPREDTE